MLKNVRKYLGQIFIVILLVSLLAVIRAFEDVLFYDPFLNFFKANYTQMPIPEIEKGKLFLHLAFRYFVNAILSLGIIFAIFKNIELVKFSGLLYVAFFILLILGFYFALEFAANNKMLIFYIRRFLIQPLLLLLFLPAFYFQERASKK